MGRHGWKGAIGNKQRGGEAPDTLCFCECLLSEESTAIHTMRQCNVKYVSDKWTAPSQHPQSAAHTQAGTRTTSRMMSAHDSAVMANTARWEVPSAVRSWGRERLTRASLPVVGLRKCRSRVHRSPAPAHKDTDRDD